MPACSPVILTVLLIEQDFKAIGLIAVKSLSDFVYCLLVCQFTIHKTARGEVRRRGGRVKNRKEEGRGGGGVEVQTGNREQERKRKRVLGE